SPAASVARHDSAGHDGSVATQCPTAQRDHVLINPVTRRYLFMSGADTHLTTTDLPTDAD
ncbi:MAG: hypothetical protein ACREQ5_21800, partial [Candidatus Dormibacteria bacterium]